VRLAVLLLLIFVAPLTTAHTMITTQVVVTFTDAKSADVRVDMDLTLLLGSPNKYYQLATIKGAQQRTQVEKIVPGLTDALQLYAGSHRLPLALRAFSIAQATQAEFLDNSVSKHSTFHFAAELDGERGSIKLISPLGAPIDYPVAYTVQIPSANVSVTRWLEAGMHESDAVEWASKLASTSDTTASVAGAPAFDPDALTWTQQLRLYLRLGFQHIVPEGTDHILFVLGLFFFGITWRKLLSQTTVFTIAHATTLFLSTYGILRLPSRIIEPAIALSIAVVAVENIVRPRIGLLRLGIVFAFGLIHGLGFASSLSDVPFPKRDFLLALLGFNFGVDFGQLFVIALAFVAVGWFRNEPWFRGRVAIPCSVAIAAVGIFWAVQRVISGFGFAA
jgi:hypothetical protein